MDSIDITEQDSTELLNICRNDLEYFDIIMDRDFDYLKTLLEAKYIFNNSQMEELEYFYNG